MEEGFKKDLLRIYALIFCIFMFFSSVAVMLLLLRKILPFIPIQILLFGIISLHIGSILLILSGRLKDSE